MRMRNEFVKENNVRRLEKKDRDDRMRNDDRSYRINFFPFTHGEQVEKRRMEEKETQKEELK